MKGTNIIWINLYGFNVHVDFRHTKFKNMYLKASHQTQKHFKYYSVGTYLRWFKHFPAILEYL